MDLICSKDGRDLSPLKNYEMDIAIGEENTLTVKMWARNTQGVDKGCVLYVEGEEYGGIVDEKEIDTASETVTFTGRSWRGVLEKRVLEPDLGQPYLRVKGEAHEVLRQLVVRMGLNELFFVPQRNSGFIVDHQFSRYCTGLSGIESMLAEVGARLQMRYERDMVTVEVVASTVRETDSDRTDFVLKSGRAVNHLICLGGGELEQRTVIHLFADSFGRVSRTQTIFGVDEVEEVYDYNNVNDDELLTAGTKRLKELQTPQLQITASFDGGLAIGDIVTATDNISGTSVEGVVSKMIVRLNRFGLTYEYGYRPKGE